MADAFALVRKHRGKGVLVDTNLFVLWLVGLVNPKRIPEFKRTRDFTVEDFHTLKELIDCFGAPLVTTQHVLSQVSDLTDLSGPERIAARRLFRAMVGEIDEKYDSAKHLVQHALFERFGLGDASVAAICERKILVLTADVQLQVALDSLGLDAINFNNVRPLGWR
jgi:hypothetical protein